MPAKKSSIIPMKYLKNKKELVNEVRQAVEQGYGKKKSDKKKDK